MNIKLSQKQIGQRITELRQMKGLSQEDLGEKCQDFKTVFGSNRVGKQNC